MSDAFMDKVKKTLQQSETDKRLRQMTDDSLREACEVLDDLMVIAYKHEDEQTAEIYQSMLIKCVTIEEERL